MKLIGLMPVRNEDWVLGLSLRVALLWCDEIVILLHECTDGSQDIVEQVIRENERGRIHVLRESGEWTEMAHRQKMLEHARAKGATHIAITDADEVLTGNLLPVKPNDVSVLWGVSVLEPQYGPPLEILHLPGYNLRGSMSRYHNNGIWGNRWFSLAFRDYPVLHWPGDRFHYREPQGAPLTPYRPIQQGEGGLMHLWGSSERRLRAKSALYKITERLRWPEKPVASIDHMYSWAIHGDANEPRYGTPATWTYANVPDAWWAPYASLMKHLHVEAEPWQEREIQRLVAKHGIEMFAGLDLFGCV